MKTSRHPNPAEQRRTRLYVILGMLGFLALAAFLVFKGFEKNMMYFVTPSDLKGQAVNEAGHFRLGGLVVKGSIKKDPDTLKTSFAVTDGGASVEVIYIGLLPDLFREGQGVIAEGSFDAGGVFHATQVLAKHDEKYMPPEVAKALKERGLWRDDAQVGAGKS